MIPLERVTLLRRYKRFMADVVRADGSEMTVHCPNTGSMKHCVLGEPQLALISDSGNPKRKYRHTLEAVQVAHGHWAGVNTSRPNALVEEAIRAGAVTGLNPGSGVEREVKYGDSRFDLALGERSDPHTFVEVKNVTLGPGPNDPDDGVIAFPDSVTERGQKHLLTLMEVVASGKRAVLFSVCSTVGHRPPGRRMKSMPATGCCCGTRWRRGWRYWRGRWRYPPMVFGWNTRCQYSCRSSSRGTNQVPAWKAPARPATSFL